MKSKLTVWITGVAVGMLALMMSGCYTQLSSTRDEEGEGYANPSYNNDSSYTEEHGRNDYGYNGGSGYYDDGCDGCSHARLGFSYYYPSTYWPSYAFTAAYNDPWYYGSYWSSSPFICGTPYVTYSPWGYYPAYVSPYYYYSPTYYRYGYVGNPSRRGSRVFGTTRGSTSGRPATGDTRFTAPNLDRGGYNLPSGARLSTGSSGSGSTVGTAQGQKNNTRQVGTQRGTTPRNNSGVSTQPSRRVRGWGSRGGTTPREGVRGSTQPQVQPHGAPAQSTSPASHPSRNDSGRHQPARSGGSRDAGSSRGSAPSYSPPPRAPSNSAPPPSSNSGSRGGNSRGGRP